MSKRNERKSGQLWAKWMGIGELVLQFLWFPFMFMIVVAAAMAKKYFFWAEKTMEWYDRWIMESPKVDYTEEEF